MTTSRSRADWFGDLGAGYGAASLDSRRSVSFELDWKGRAETGRKPATTPEEFLGAALASCFSMALANALAKNYTPSERISVEAEVDFSPTEGITTSRLYVVARVAGITYADFDAICARTKRDCPVVQTLRSTSVELHIELA